MEVSSAASTTGRSKACSVGKRSRVVGVTGVAVGMSVIIKKVMGLYIRGS